MTILLLGMTINVSSCLRICHPELVEGSLSSCLSVLWRKRGETKSKDLCHPELAEGSELRFLDRLGMTEKIQIPPLRYTSVGMIIAVGKIM
jgi:hypothetical protein